MQRRKPLSGGRAESQGNEGESLETDETGGGCGNKAQADVRALSCRTLSLPGGNVHRLGKPQVQHGAGETGGEIHWLQWEN